jgi:E3 ubiquitin-protein ligase HERC3
MGVSTLVLLMACGAESPDSTTIAPMVVTTMEDLPVTFALDVTGPYTAVGILPPTHGDAMVDGLVVTYRPETNFFGTDVFRAYASTEGRVSETAIEITVLPVNDALIVFNDELAAMEDTPLSVPADTLLANDVEIEGEPVTVTSVGNASYGTVSLAQGTITFVPDPNFFGGAGFEYVVSDGTDTSTASVQVIVANTSDPPVAVADAATVAKNTSLWLFASTLLANDQDPDGSTSLSVVGVANCVNCGISSKALPPGEFWIYPAQDFTGIASVDYTITDGSQTSTATITITVTP